MDYYERNKDAELDYKWARQLKKREEARIFVEAYKCTHPCVDRNEKDPEALTFDHVRGIKKMAISQMVNQSYSIEALVAEISKCEIHCWTCHMTAENRYRIANEWPLT